MAGQTNVNEDLRFASVIWLRRSRMFIATAASKQYSSVGAAYSIRREHCAPTGRDKIYSAFQSINVLSLTGLQQARAEFTNSSPHLPRLRVLPCAQPVNTLLDHNESDVDCHQELLSPAMILEILLSLLKHRKPGADHLHVHAWIECRPVGVRDVLVLVTDRK